MATHDYVIANQSGAAFRTDLNNALAAIVSNNSNSSAPSTTYAYQIWVDTSANIIKIRNSANNAWINLFTTAGGVDVDAASNFNEDVVFTGASHSVTFDKSANSFIFNDNAKAVFGTGSDFQIKHTGSNSQLIHSGTGDLFLDSIGGDVFLRAGDNAGGVHPSVECDLNAGVKLFFDNTKRFETTSSGVSVAGNVVATGNMQINDGNFLNVGNSGDLQISHDGSTNIIDGQFHPIEIRHQSEVHIKCVDDGAVELYNNNQKKFETRSDGVIIPDSQNYYCGDGADLRMFFNGTDGFIRAEAGNLNLDKAGGEKFIVCKPDAEVELYFDNSQKFETNTAGCSITGKIHTQLGTSINSFNKESTGDQIVFNTTGTTRGSISSNGSTVAFNTSASDRSMKKNFENWTENTLNLFKNINPQKFNFLDQEDGTDKEKGFIAQDMVASFPEAYQKDNDDDKYMFNASGMVVYLMKAIQELEAKVAALEAA